MDTAHANDGKFSSDQCGYGKRKANEAFALAAQGTPEARKGASDGKRLCTRLSSEADEAIDGDDSNAARAAPPDGRRWFTDGRRLGPPATYNKYLSVMATVRTLGMKEKRELFKLMREGVVGKRGRVTEHTFIPRLGVTMGEFALFYVLIDNPRGPL
jgi:hypothetical protein